MESNQNKKFLATKAGTLLLTVVIFIAIYLLLAVPGIILGITESEKAYMISLMIFGVPITVAAIFSGWRALSMITPDIFVIMPIVGWIIYFFIKLILSTFIGIFTFPYQIAKRISISVENRAQVWEEEIETVEDTIYEPTNESLVKPNNIVYLTDEDDGSQIEFQLLDLIEYDNSFYVVLLPTDDDDCDEVLILLYESYDDQEGETYSSVDDDDILKNVYDIFKERHKDEFNFVD